MSSDNKTHVECRNPNVITALVVAVRSRGIDYTGCKEWKDGDTEIVLSTMNYIPLGIVQTISKQFPDEIIICEYCYETNLFEIYKEEYLNGEVKSYDIKPGYSYSGIPLNNENDRKGIYDTGCFLLSQIGYNGKG